MDLFARTWQALRDDVAALPQSAFARPSGCRGWLVRDLVCHLVIDAQDVLITLATPAEDAPSADALSYWTPTPDLPDGHHPLDALTVRLAAAYEDPALLRDHLEDVGAAAGRAAQLTHPSLPVATQGKSLLVRDFLDAYVLEWVLHHLDLVAHLDDGEGSSGTGPTGAGLSSTGPTGAGLSSAGPAGAGPADAGGPQGPSADALAAAREMVERRLRLALPSEWADADALRVATGRRPATAAERTALDALGPRGQMLPLSFG